METLARLGFTHRRRAYHYPEGNSYIERFRGARFLQPPILCAPDFLCFQAAMDLLLDRGVQTRPAALWRAKSHSAQGHLEFVVDLKNDALTA